MSQMRFTHFCMVLLTFGFGPSMAEDVSFNRDIRPILSDKCFLCHGPDEHGRQADLRLDDRQSAIDYGAITPGDPSASLMIERMESSDEDVVMPPPDSGKTVSPEELAIVKAWIAAGAEYQKHWSFVPVPETVRLPETPGAEDWARSDLDRFVFATLRARGLQPAREADKSQWMRRVCFDLTGLPPTTEQLDAFLQDNSPAAYELAIDRLLESEAYGERMANMWLDVARYADTFGYQNDVAMEVWPWRDWVIRAFNDNLPYDQFVQWQTAGDLLPNATRDQKLATAFNRLHRQTNEGGSIPEEFRQANVADRTTTNATAFMGLTFECARCHDHKYDPILQKDFYRLSAYFADIDELGLYSHFTFSAPTPALLLYEGNQESQHTAALQEIARCEARWRQVIDQSTAYWTEHADQLIQVLPCPPQPDFAFPLDGDQPGVVGQATLCNGDDEIPCKETPQFGRHDPVSFSLWIKPAVNQPRMIVLHQSVAAEDSAFRGLQITIDNGHPEMSLIHFWPGDALRVQTTETIPVGEWTHLATTYDGSGRAAGLRMFINGRLAAVQVVRDQLTRDILHRSEWHDMNVGQVELALGARFRDIGFRDGVLDDLQVFQRQLSDAEVAAIFSAVDASTEPTVLTDAMRIQHKLLTADDAFQAAAEELLAARRRENEIMTGVRQIMTMRTAIAPRKSYLLHRGAYDDRGEEVEPGTPAFLFANGLAPQTRLGLAQWMTDQNHPLVSRVIVNRFWHLFFGRGIVASLEDFGSQGSPPTHPELLDWLARRLMDDGWDLKQLCRHIVLSATYRQSSIPRDLSLLDSDRDNRWLARGPKHRLSAEQVRDAALLASGLLVKKIGGPSVMPYQPEGLWEESGTGKKYTQATGEGLHRRSLYTFWKRTAPPPSMLTFDATSRETCTAKRELTTTPLQALVLLNDPQYVEAARVLAEELVAKFHDNLTARWAEVFRRLVSRSPSDRELAIVDALYNEQLSYFRMHPENATAFLEVGEATASNTLPADEMAATTVVVEMLLSYDETMMKR